MLAPSGKVIHIIDNPLVTIILFSHYINSTVKHLTSIGPSDIIHTFGMVEICISGVWYG